MTYAADLRPATFTGMNGETGSNSDDAYGRLAGRSSPLGWSASYAHDYTQHTVTVTTTGSQMPQRFERTTTDGLGRTVKAEAGGDATSILSIVETQYAPCACSPLGKVSQVS